MISYSASASSKAVAMADCLSHACPWQWRHHALTITRRWKADNNKKGSLCKIQWYRIAFCLFRGVANLASELTLTPPHPNAHNNPSTSRTHYQPQPRERPSYSITSSTKYWVLPWLMAIVWWLPIAPCMWRLYHKQCAFFSSQNDRIQATRKWSVIG